MSYNKLASAAPYFDQGENARVNNFLRILFNPGRAVQAAELTTLATILQNQIGSLAQNILKDNTSVFQAKINVSNKKPTATISPFAVVYNSGTSTWSASTTQFVAITDAWIGKTFQNSDPYNAGATPSQTLKITGYSQQPGLNPILYYEYSGSNATNNQVFYDSDTSSNGVGGITILGTPTSSLVASCQAGIIWTNGHFVTVLPQDVIISNTPNTGTFKVGFTVTEDVVTSQDPTVGNTLLDPANGSYNYNAPGADRYRLTPTLAFYDISQEANLSQAFLNSFVPFVLVSNGSVVQDNPGTQYSDILQLLAERTYDEAGNFAVDPFPLILSEAADLKPNPGESTVNLADYPGYLPSVSTDINDYLVAEMGPGKVYVYGYEIQKFLSTRILIFKGRDTIGATEKVIPTNSPFFLIADLANQNTAFSAQINGQGALQGSTFQPGWLQPFGNERVQIMSGLNGTGKVLSTARLVGIDKRGSIVRLFLTDSNTPFMTNIQSWNAVGPGTGGIWPASTYCYYDGKIFVSLNDVPSGSTNPEIDITNWDYVQSSETPNTIGGTKPLRLDNIQTAKSIRSVNNNNSSGAIYVNLAQQQAAGVSYPLYGGAPSPLIYPIPNVDVLKQHSTTAQIKMVGQYNVTVSTSGSNLVGTITIADPNGAFENEENDLIIFATVQTGTAQTTGMMIDVSEISANSTANVLNLDFTNVQVTGVDGNPYSLAAGNIVSLAVVEIHDQAVPRTKTLQTQTVNVTISDPTTDIANLGYEDIYEIISIQQVDNNADGSSNRNLTSQELACLSFDNGQRDYWYDVGAMIGFSKLWNSNKAAVQTTGSNPTYVPTTYAIQFKYFVHSSNPDQIFFSQGSYPDFTPDLYVGFPVHRSPYYGGYDLLTSLDFRRKLSEMENPGTYDIKWPLPFDQTAFTSTTEYVGRVDNIWVDRSGNFGVTRGLASKTPVKPTNPNNVMNLYTLHIPAYTFSKSTVGIEADKNSRYTMKDISKLEDRIKRLEDVVSLTLLEQNAFNMSVIDPSTGFDRFKSGIFTDSFQDHSRANASNVDYRMTIDSTNSCGQCPVEFFNFKLAPLYQTNGQLTSDSTVQQYADVFTIPPSGTLVLAENKYASGTINLNPYLFYVWNGHVTISPAVDTWYETRYLPAQVVNIGSWNPPPGYSPVPKVDEIQTTWTGVSQSTKVTTSSKTVTPPPATPTTSSNTGTSDAFLGRPVIWYPPKGAPGVGGINPHGSVVDWAEPINATQAQLDRMAARAQELPSGPISGYSIGSVVSPNYLYKTSSTQSTNKVDSTSDVGNATANGPSTQFYQTTTTYNDKYQYTDTKQVTTTQSLVRSQTSNTDDRIVDVSSIPYMRPQTVHFVAEGLRPGVQVTGTFDGKPIDLIPDNDYVFGGVWRSDSTGKIEGSFKIPANTYTTGSKVFSVVDTDNTSGGDATYTAKGILTTHQDTITTIRTVSVRTNTSTVDLGTTQTLLSSTPVQSTTVPTAPPPGYRDPIAESFFVSTPGGCFLNSLTLYFATKSGDFESQTLQSNGQTLAATLAGIYGSQHPKDFGDGSADGGLKPVFVYLVNMENGIPTSNIVPFSMKVLYPDQITSDPLVPSRGATTITWDNPIFLNEATEYAIVLFSSSKEYYMWTSQLGQQDIFQNGASNPGKGISQQTFLGSFFESQNSKTWTAEQTIDLTFSLTYNQYPVNSPYVLVLEDVKDQDDDAYAGDSALIFDNVTAYNLKDVVLHTWNDLSTGQLQPKQKGYFRNRIGPIVAGGAPPVTDSAGPGQAPTLNPNWTQITPDLYNDVRFVNKRYGNSVFPIIGELAVNGTTISYQHMFYQGTTPPGGTVYSSMINQAINDVTMIGVPNTEKQLDNNGNNRQNYRVQVTLQTSNPNVTPVLDKQQMRASLRRNIVLGVDPDLLFGGLSNAQVATLSASQLATVGQLAININYPKYSVVYLAGSPNAYYMYNGSAPKTYTVSDTLAGDFYADVKNGLWVLTPNYEPPLIDGIPGVGDAGTYISQTVNLDNPADDLKVIIDVMKNSNSYLNVYFNTQQAPANYVYSTSYGTDGLVINNFTNQEMKIKYLGSSGDANSLSSTNPATQTVNPLVTVSGFDTGGNNRYKVYLSATTEVNCFGEGLTYNSDGSINENVYQNFAAPFAGINNIFLVPSSVTDLDDLTELAPWSSVASYNQNAVVTTSTPTTDGNGDSGIYDYFNFRVWKAQGYIAPEWNSATTYTANQVVIVPSSGTGQPFVAYTCLVGNTNVNPVGDTTGKWQIMLTSAGQPAPAFGIGTKPSTLGTAWVEIPSINIRSAMKIDHSNDGWKPMIQENPGDISSLADGTYYEMTLSPKIKPTTQFNNFAIRIDMRTQGNDRIKVPSIKNLRAISSI